MSLAYNTGKYVYMYILLPPPAEAVAGAQGASRDSRT